MLEEKQLKFHIERYGNIAHLWQLRAVQRRQASRARHQQHSSDQRSRRLASYGDHGAGRVGHCAAAQGISAVSNKRTIVFQSDPGYCPFDPEHTELNYDVKAVD